MLEVKDLVKVYKTKDGQETRALDGISLSFGETGMVFILGKSGSGKSTLLHVCGGLDSVDQGEIIVKGKSSKDFAPNDYDSYRNTYAGFIFQEYNILEDFTVEDNIAIALELQGKPKDAEQIAQILQQVDLEGYGKRKPNTLSGGQKQRVAIARALVKNPEIIFADEPTGALDSETGKQVLDTLKKLSQDKLVIVVSHDKEFAEQYGDRIIELQDGKVIRDVQKVTLSKQGKPLKSPKFEPLTEQPKQKEYTKQDQIWIRSRLPMRHAVKIGLSSIKTRPVKFTVTVIMALLAFCLVGLFSCLMFYNEKTVIQKSLADSGTQYLRMSKYYIYNETQYAPSGKSESTVPTPAQALFSQAEIDTISQSLGDDVIPTYGIMYAMIENLSYGESMFVSEFFYSNDIRGFVPSSAKLEYISGRAPVGDGEIAISDYMFESICHGQLTDPTSGEVLINITNYDQAVIVIKGKTLRISGVYKGEPIDDKYRNMDKQDQDLHQAWDQKRMFGFYSYAVIDETCMETFADLVGTYPSMPPMNYVTGPYTEFRYNPDSLRHGYNSHYALLDNVAYIDNHGNAVSAGATQTKSMVLDSKTYFTLVDEVVQQMLLSPDEANAELREIYQNSELKGLLELLKNSAFSSANLIQQKGKQALDILQPYIDLDAMRFSLTFTTTDEVFVSDIHVIGFNTVGGPILRMAYASQDILDAYIGYAGQNAYYTTATTEYRPSTDSPHLYQTFFARTGQSMQQIRSIMAYDNAVQQDGSYYRAENDLIVIIQGFSFLIGVLAQVFLYVGIAFVIFTVLLFANFISASIAKKKKEIGILRALGARGSDVFKIFFIEAGIIAGICMIVANLVTAVLASVINAAMSSALSFSLSIFVFGIASVGLIIAIACVTGVLATLLPVYKESRKKPVESIRQI